MHIPDRTYRNIIQNRLFMYGLICCLLFFMEIFIAEAKPLAGDTGQMVLRIKGIKNKKCYLGYFINSTEVTVADTLYFDQSGTARFTLKDRQPQGFYLLTSDSLSLDLLITGSSFMLQTDMSDPVLHTKVSGSPENEVYYNYKKFIRTQKAKVDSIKRIPSNAQNAPLLKAEIEKINRQVAEYRMALFGKYPGYFATRLIKAGIDPKPVKPAGDGPEAAALMYNYRKHFFDAIDFTDPRVLHSPYGYSKLEKFISLITPLPPDSINMLLDALILKSKVSDESYRFILEYLFEYTAKAPLSGMDLVYTHLAEKYYLSGQAPWMEKDLREALGREIARMKPVLTGKAAPALLLPDPAGNKISLLDVVARYTIVYFWDSQCSHCAEATPQLHTFYQRIREDSVAVFAVSVEETQESWKAYIKDHHLDDWLNACDPVAVPEIFRQYNLKTTPAIFILDRNKKIVRKNMTVRDVEDFFRKASH